MKRKFMRIYLVLAILLSLASCATEPVGPAGLTERETLFQISTIDALLVGAYDGQITFGDLKRHGGFGLGTFDALDGEMIAFDGNFYQIRADGRAYPVKDSMTTPFAAVTFFEADRMIDLPDGTDFDSLQKIVDEALPTLNLFYALRIEGTFDYMKTRSVPAQAKPYPPLAEVTENQPEFEFRNIKGTVAGFRCPPFVKGINVPGYHLHFLTEDKTAGGHILAFKLKEGRLAVDITSDFYLVLPRKENLFFSADLGQDREGELHRVEK